MQKLFFKYIYNNILSLVWFLNIYVYKKTQENNFHIVFLEEVKFEEMRKIAQIYKFIY